MDKRSDVWSFGVVLFECLTGKRLFPGESVTDSIGALLHKEIDWSQLPPNTPPNVQLLLRKCLARDRKRRLPDIGAARLDLEHVLADPSSSAIQLSGAALADRPQRRGFSAASLAAAALSTLLIGAALTWLLKPAPALPDPPAPPPLPVRQVVMDLQLDHEETADAIEAAFIMAAHGDLAGARLRLGSHPAQVRSRLEREPANERLWNVSHALVAACLKIDRGFPMTHIARRREGACLQLKDPALLMTLRDTAMVLVSFDRDSLAHHAGLLTREGVGHSGAILYRRTVSRVAYGTQARLLVDHWREAAHWDWADRIVYLPRS